MWDQYACFKFYLFIFFQGCFTLLNFDGEVTILILILRVILHLILKYTLIIIVKQSLLLQILFHLKQKKKKKSNATDTNYFIIFLQTADMTLVFSI